MLEEYCYEPSRFRGCAVTMACGFGLRRGTKPPCARAVPRSARWRGAPADAPPGDSEGVTRVLRLQFFVGCRLARGRSVPRGLPRAFGSAPFAGRGSVLATAREGLAQWEVKTPWRVPDHPFTPPQFHFFWLPKVSFVPYNSECVQAALVCDSGQLSGNDICSPRQLRALSLR